MTEKCKKCKGKGRVKCEYCASKAGRTAPAYFAKNCPQCKGTKMIVCPRGEGTGWSEAPNID